MRQNNTDQSYGGLTRVIVGGERGPGDKRDSSTWGSLLSSFTFPFPWFVGFVRDNQRKMNVMDNTIMANPPTTPVDEMEDIGSCRDNPKTPAYHRRLHPYDLQQDPWDRNWENLL